MKRLMATTAAAALLAGCGSGGSSASPKTVGGFMHDSADVTNAWFPIRPGMTWTYRGTKDGRATHEIVDVRPGAKVIRGVRCAIVRDRLFTGRHVSERTTDWYAQDAKGNVWYFGEDTAELDAKGDVRSTEGSWQAGRNGARQGLFMPTRPRVGQTARQEYFRTHAEDHFRVKALGVRVSSPAVSSKRGLLTSEWTPLEPGVLDHKLYVRGVGTVREESVRGPVERNVLVSFRR
jgi:hypothetical protein